MINERPVDDPKLQAALNEIRDVMERSALGGPAMTEQEQQRAIADNQAWFAARARVAARRAKMAYFDVRCPERLCDHCGRPYRGPAVFCCLECAVADA